MRTGFTLAELSVSIALLGLMAGMTLPRLTQWRHRISADAAAASTVTLIATARHVALRRDEVTALRFDTTSGIIFVHIRGDTIERRPIGEVHGVKMTVSRDSIAFGPSGLGYGAANTRVILTRGTAAETVTVSRLGRARR